MLRSAIIVLNRQLITGYHRGQIVSMVAPLRSFSDDKNPADKTAKVKRKLPDTTNPNTPLGVLDRIPKGVKDQKASKVAEEEEPLNVYSPFPDATNPSTGEVGGPVGPEPTRFGDWERKGRVSDF